MRTNVARPKEHTHEGGSAAPQRPLAELRRTVATCLLWEPTFYEKGSDIAARIEALCEHVSASDLQALAIQARREWKLRHVPLFIACQLARRFRGTLDAGLIGSTLAEVIQRPDELTEFLSLYWRKGRTALSKQVKVGLARAFQKFSAYQLAKWNRDGAVKLRDVLFLCHAKPRDAEQDALWKQLITGTLPPADTWEVALSSGADKKATWERLLGEKALGYMALLQNLRNMEQANVDAALVETALREGAVRSKALPFRFISAAKHAPGYAAALSDAMCAAITDKIDGETYVIVDVSGSMDEAISGKSQLVRWEAAAALAILVREMAPACRVFTFSHQVAEVPNYRGLPLSEGIGNSQQHGGTWLRQALEAIKAQRPAPHRLIVITDEQSHDGIAPPWSKWAYLVNVAPYKPGLDTSQGWERINGWSEGILSWIKVREAERSLST